MFYDMRNMLFLVYLLSMYMLRTRKEWRNEGIMNRCRKDFIEAHKEELLQLVDEKTVRPIHRCQSLYWKERNDRIDCGKYEKDTEEYKKCSRCKKTFYCSKECQVADWKIHKHSCNKKKE